VWKWIAVHHFHFVTGWQEIKIDMLVENFVLVGLFVCLFVSVCFRFIILGVFFFIL